MFNKFLQVILITLICGAAVVLMRADNLINWQVLLFQLTLTYSVMGLVFSIKNEIINRTDRTDHKCKFNGRFADNRGMEISKDIFDAIADKTSIGSVGYHTTEENLHDTWSSGCICRPTLTLSERGTVSIQHSRLTDCN